MSIETGTRGTKHTRLHHNLRRRAIYVLLEPCFLVSLSLQTAGCQDSPAHDILTGDLYLSAGRVW